MLREENAELKDKIDDLEMKQQSEDVDRIIQ